MIWTLITIVILVASIAVLLISHNHWGNNFFDWAEIISIMTGVSSFIVLLLLCCWILSEHVSVNNTIRKNQIAQDSLEKRLELVNSEYEDVSKSDIIKDIAEWNADVINDYYWAENPWTNWFYNKKVVYSRHTIEY